MFLRFWLLLRKALWGNKRFVSFFAQGIPKTRCPDLLLQVYLWFLNHKTKRKTMMLIALKHLHLVPYFICISILWDGSSDLVKFRQPVNWEARTWTWISCLKCSKCLHALKPLSYRVSFVSITYLFVFSLIQQIAQDVLFWYRRYSGELWSLWPQGLSKWGDRCYNTG